jgi:hypothetical protein
LRKKERKNKKKWGVVVRTGFKPKWKGEKK